MTFYFIAGKTVQVIAFLCALHKNHGIWGPHLIVMPLSVMTSWKGGDVTYSTVQYSTAYYSIVYHIMMSIYTDSYTRTWSDWWSVGWGNLNLEELQLRGRFLSFCSLLAVKWDWYYSGLYFVLLYPTFFFTYLYLTLLCSTPLHNTLIKDTVLCFELPDVKATL